MMLPLVSVIIPTYNYAEYIKDAIESLLQQTYPKECIEIIVIDDGSTDNTAEILTSYVEAGLIKYIYQDNSGKAAATKRGIDLCKGAYVFNLDADDLYLPQKIELTVAIFTSDKDIVHVATPARIWLVDKNEYKIETVPSELMNKKISGEDVLKHFYSKNILYGGGSTFSGRADIVKAIPIPASVNMYIDEYLIVAVLNKGYSFFINKELSVWRVHQKNFSVENTLSKIILRQQVLLQNSQAILELINEGEYPSFMKKAYLLQHETRRIYFKELEGEKSIMDILKYLRVIIKNRFSFKILKSYSAFNRLAPAIIIKYMKQYFFKLKAKHDSKN